MLRLRREARLEPTELPGYFTGYSLPQLLRGKSHISSYKCDILGGKNFKVFKMCIELFCSVFVLLAMSGSPNPGSEFCPTTFPPPTNTWPGKYSFPLPTISIPAIGEVPTCTPWIFLDFPALSFSLHWPLHWNLAVQIFIMDASPKSLYNSPEAKATVHLETFRIQCNWLDTPYYPRGLGHPKLKCLFFFHFKLFLQ